MAAIPWKKWAGTDESIKAVRILVRREIRDALHDWRIVTPIVILTLFFPALMSFVADLALDWVARYGAPIIGERIIPFLLMVVGFFPISFSLVIALETFVGEKERNSLEPLLATPLTDAQLYMGKMLAAMVPPLLAAYLGFAVYLAGLYFFKGWTPEWELLVLMIALTTAEGLVMVSAAVVLSSQATSVRAANLLASFVIVPVALLLQGEAIIMFYANYGVLWWILLFLIVVDVILVRMGVHLFNREELLGREIDELNLGSVWRTFKTHFVWERWFFGRDVEKGPFWLKLTGTICGLYLRELPALLRRSWLAFVLVGIGICGAVFVGCDLAARYNLPAEALRLEELTPEVFTALPDWGWLPNFTPLGIFINNVRALVLAWLLAIFSFGTLAVALLMAPLAIVFFFAAQAARLGYDPFLFLATFVLPHGLFELPAAIIATALSVRLGAALMSPPRGATVGENWLRALAEFTKAFLALTLPLLALAAVIEVYITPLIVILTFSRPGW